MYVFLLESPFLIFLLGVGVLVVLRWLGMTSAFIGLCSGVVLTVPINYSDICGPAMASSGYVVPIVHLLFYVLGYLWVLLEVPWVGWAQKLSVAFSDFCGLCVVFAAVLIFYFLF